MKLPRSRPGKDVIKAFLKLGYLEDHTTGDHVVLYSEDEDHRRRLTVPKHKCIKAGLLRRLLRDSGFSVREISEHL